MTGLPIPGDTFRRRELERLLALLSERGPAVVVLRGEPGMGKTSLLGDLRSGAAIQGWEIAGGDRDTRLIIHPHTREPDFYASIFAAADATNGITAPPTHRLSGDAVIGELVRLAPLLILIDDYRPSPWFANWFEGAFLPAIPRSRYAVVVVIAERRGCHSVERLATDIVELGPLDPKAVRSLLDSMLPPLDPPLSSRERQHYVRAGRNPTTLASLIRVLSLASHPEGLR